MARALNKRNRCHTGLTLLELLLALAIFLASLAALSQLLASGSRAAAQSRVHTEAVFRCESKLAEIVAGVEPIEDSANVPFDDDRRWIWSATIEQGELPGLNVVEVTVRHEGQNASGNTSCELRRFVRDPRLFEREDAELAIVVDDDPDVIAVPSETPDEPEDADQ